MKKKNILLVVIVVILGYIIYDASCKPSEGLGDTLAHFLQSLGIEKVPVCRCEKRHQTLNRLFPYHTRLQIWKDSYSAQTPKE